MRGDPLASRRIATTQAILPLLMTILKPRRPEFALGLFISSPF
jgi:hypothetical protein